jgi:hypothetical protein
MRPPSRTLTITQGNLNNHHLYLKEILDFFPEDVFGGSVQATAGCRMIRIHWGREVVETDIDRTKTIFRKRAWVARFFQAYRVRPGDRLLLERLEPYVYRLTPIRQTSVVSYASRPEPDEQFAELCADAPVVQPHGAPGPERDLFSFDA